MLKGKKLNFGFRSVVKYGNSLGVLLPRKAVDILDIVKGDNLLVSVEDGKVILEKRKSVVRGYE